MSKGISGFFSGPTVSSIIQSIHNYLSVAKESLWCKSLDGGDGNSYYNDFWQHAFFFHSPQYLSISKEVYPVARALTDHEVDTLYQWLQDNYLWGLPVDVLSENRERIKEELPGIGEKILP